MAVLTQKQWEPLFIWRRLLSSDPSILFRMQRKERENDLRIVFARMKGSQLKGILKLNLPLKKLHI